MRAVFVVLLCCLLLVAPAWSEEPPTEAESVEAALKAAQDSDDKALAAIAGRGDPDPWWIVDTLCARGEHEAAVALARHHPTDKDALATYIEADRKRGGDKAGRALLEQVFTHGDKDAWDQVLEATAALVAAADPAPPATVARARALGERAYASKQRGDVAAADGAYRVAIAHARALGWDAERRAMLQAAFRFAGALMEGSQVAAAIRIYDALRTEVESHGPKAYLGYVLGALGKAHEREGAYEKALEAYRKTHAAMKDAGQALPAARAQVDMSSALLRLGKRAEAMKLAQASLDELAAIPEPEAKDARVALAYERAAAHRGVADVHYQAARYSEAAAAYKTAMDLLEGVRQQDSDLGAAIATNHGMVLLQQGQFGAAVNMHMTALKIRTDAGQHVKIAQAGSNLAATYTAAGDYDEALKHFRDAMAILEAHPSRPIEAEVHERLGNLYQWLGDFRQALARYEVALKHWRELPCTAGQVRVRGNQGVALRSQRKYAEARSAYEAALKMLGEEGNADNRATLLMNLGDVLDALGAYEDAESAYNEAKKIFVALKDESGVLTARMNLAEVLHHRGDAADAMEALEEVADEAEDGQQEPLVIAARVMHARAAIDAGEFDDAVGEATSALLSLQRNLFGGLGDEHGSFVRSRNRDVFRVGAVAAARAGDKRKLYRFLDRGRAGAFANALSRREVTQRYARSVPEPMQAAKTAARAAYEVARKDFEAARAGTDDAAIARARQALDEAIDKQADADAAIAEWLQDKSSSEYVKSGKLKDLQAILGPKEAFVFYGLFEEDRGPADKRIDEALALVVRANDARIVDLGKASALRAVCGALTDPEVMKSLGTRGGTPRGPTARMNWTAEAAKVRAAVVTPLKLDPQVTRVIVSPVAELCYLPLGPLFERPVANALSATAQVLLAKGEGGKRGKGILALGRPDYSTVSKSARAIYYGDAPLTDLPGTEEEATKISTGAPLLGAQANAPALRKALADHGERLRALHFACHGRVDEVRPSLSVLALAAAEGDDGFLTAGEIRELDIMADLVVLSACDTSRGQLVNGEGIRGLSRSFMSVGPPRVICSLWPVDDKATRALMIKFYELWSPKDGSTGLPAAEALAAAQAHIRDNTTWKDPRYWAAWVLWGLPGA